MKGTTTILLVSVVVAVVIVVSVIVGVDVNAVFLLLVVINFSLRKSDSG